MGDTVLAAIRQTNQLFDSEVIAGRNFDALDQDLHGKCGQAVGNDVLEIGTLDDGQVVASQARRAQETRGERLEVERR